MDLSYIYTGSDGFKSRNYSAPFNRCRTNYTVIEDNIFIPDYITSDNSYIWYWLWILPTISSIFAVLRELDHRNKITFMSKIFGPPIKLVDFWQGPNLPNTDRKEVYLQSYVIKERI